MRFPNQISVNRSRNLLRPTCLYNEISLAAMELVNENLPADTEIYAISVHCEKLSRNGEDSMQQQFFLSEEEEKSQKLFSLETAVDKIRKRFGKNSISIASAINNPLI